MADKPKLSPTQQKIQSIAGTVLILAFVAVIVALIIKFIMWLFGL